MTIENMGSTATTLNPQPMENRAPGDDLSNFINDHGETNGRNAINNVFRTEIANYEKDQILASDLPQFRKDEQITAIDQSVRDSWEPTTDQAESDASALFKEHMQAFVETMASDRNAEINEEAQNAEPGSSGAEARSAGGAGGSQGGNWLTVLAKAMGDVAGNHLSNAVLTGNKISNLETITDTGDAGLNARAAQAKEMTGLQAAMQADTQMFKLSQEATSTIVKSVGEALTGTARKT